MSIVSNFQRYFMKKLWVILSICLMAISCVNEEVTSDQFIGKALEGVLIVSLDTDVTTKAKYSEYCDWILFNDGTCRRCYFATPSSQAKYPLLYQLHYWEYDSTAKSITITDPKLLDRSPNTAVGTLYLDNCTGNNFTLVGTVPTPEDADFEAKFIHGRIGTAEERATFEKNYLEEGSVK